MLNEDELDEEDEDEDSEDSKDSLEDNSSWLEEDRDDGIRPPLQPVNDISAKALRKNWDFFIGTTSR